MAKAKQVYDPTSGKMRAAAPAPKPTPTPVATVTPASDLVKLRPNPVTGQMTFAGDNPQTVQQVKDRYAGMGYNVGASGGSTTTAAQPDPYAYERAAEAERKRVARQNALATVRGALEQFGLTSMLDLITQYVQQDYDAESIMVLLRQSPQYKQRFPAMEALAKKGRALSEAEYIAFERNASQLERAYGLPAGMLGKDAVTKLLTNEVSAQELENRVTMAAAGAFQTSPEVKQQFRNYYGIDSGGLTAYFLDPERAMPLLQKQYVSAQIGAEAAMQSIDLGVSMAEELQVAGINQQQAREGFGRVAGQRELSMGRGDIVSQQELIKGNLTGDTAAQQAIERAGAARVGRFAGGGQYLQTQQGTIGLGTAATR